MRFAHLINTNHAQDALFASYSRSMVPVSTLSTSIVQAAATGATLSAAVQAIVANVIANATATSTSVIQTLSTQASSSVVAIGTELSTAQSTATVYQATLSSSMSSLVASRTTFNAALEDEQVALPNIQNTIEALLAVNRLQLNVGFNDDAVDRASITVEASTYLNTLWPQINQYATAFSAQEISRAAVKAANLSTQASAIVFQDASDQVVALNAEYSKANAGVPALMAASALGKAAVQTGSTDYTAWFVVYLVHVYEFTIIFF